jgi:cell division GTPase FtsZ
VGTQVTEGLGAGSQPEVGRAAVEEAINVIRDHLTGAHMVFVTAGMGGGTGTGAAPIIAKTARELGILTIGVVTKPFHFEGQRRMRFAEVGIVELLKVVDTLLIIPNQNLFRVANEKTTFADAFALADQVLYSGVACISDLIVKEGLINLDFADVLAVMREPNPNSACSRRSVSIAASPTSESSPTKSPHGRTTATSTTPRPNWQNRRRPRQAASTVCAKWQGRVSCGRFDRFSEVASAALRRRARRRVTMRAHLLRHL